MSWQLVSFALVLLALVLAAWWYERSRPGAKLLALVATLAALAALGRDAFAAIPDVKPTTAIVLVAGAAFGAGPGFGVGAIAALASNALLGEGPWTPWQMLGWGLVGLLGGALGRLCGRRLSRLGLAAACAAGAAIFNLVVDLYTWTGAGSHTLAAFALVLGAAAVFDGTHVVASFLFGLAFGPALLRMLLRVRARLEVSWGQPPAQARAAGAQASARTGPSSAGLLIALALLACAVPATARARPQRHAAASIASAGSLAPATRRGISRAVGFLARAQNADGGFGGAPGHSSSELYSAWAALGLAAAGRDPRRVRRDGRSVLDALRGEAASLHGAGDLERTILALRASGASPHSLSGGDPVARLLRFRDRSGSFGHLVNLTAFAILALRAAGFPRAGGVLGATAGWLARQQEGDGGFSFAGHGGGSDVDDTAGVIQALVAAGQRRGVARAAGFLIRAQNRDGGYPQQPGGASNAQSTAWAIQGLVAAGRNVNAVTRAGSRSPLGYLQSLIAPDGSVRYSRTGTQTPVWVTAQALTALARRPFPIAPVPGGKSPRAVVAAQAPAGIPPSMPGAGGTRRPAPAPAARARPAGAWSALSALLAPLMRWLSSGL